MALHDLDMEALCKGKQDTRVAARQLKQIGHKLARQLGKDYVVFSLLTGPQFTSTITANATANLMRNLWSYTVSFCSHFPDDAEKFTEDMPETKTQHEWCPRQMLGSASFKAGPIKLRDVSARGA